MQAFFLKKGCSIIAEYLQNTFETGEIDENAVCQEFRHTAEDGESI
ncbi:hypothetical protein LMF89_01255 [Pelosinus sp. Bkl1]|uniref:Uncharacterized protein n=1 Tax=Pelosinus baikalensis TaxID=2892015 RepID=A0ABS8HLE5_9FIRM|nr:hypothetical protein [Pelosinus baikalensis]